MRNCFRWMWAASLAITGSFTHPSQAQNFTWTAASLFPSDWNNSGNWSPSGPPMGPSQFAVFTGQTPSFVPSISSGSVSLGGLIFQNLTSSQNYAITSGNANTMTLTGQTSIFMDSTVSASSFQVINLNNPAGALLVPGGTPLSIVNNASFSSNPTLTFSSTTGLNEVSGASQLFISGTGHTRLGGPVSLNGGFTKRGSGRVSSTGNWSSALGGTTLAGGSVVLDYSGTANFRLPAGTLNLDGVALSLTNAGSTNSFTETTGSPTVLNPGHSTLSVNAATGTSLGINLGALSSTGGTLNVGITGPGFVNTTSALVNSLVGAYATVATGGSVSWATKDASNNIQPLNVFGLNTYAAGVNTDVTNPFGPTGTTNSLRYNVNLASFHNLAVGTLTLQSGGILVTPNVTNDILIGGGSNTLATPGSTPIYVQHYGSAPLTIGTFFNSAGGLVKAGPGELVIERSGVTGPIHVNQGNLTVTGVSAINSASGLFFNERNSGTGQRFGVDIGNNVNGSITRPIQLGTETNAATIFSTGASENSRITLSGVISSKPGATTDLTFTDGFVGNQTSGFNLTGPNTFTGNVRLSQGTLGIQSNANLGNAANSLTLAHGSSTHGGLEFLSGANLSRSVAVTSTSRVVTPQGINAIISGVISGGSPLHKDGLGTLNLTGANTHTGSIVVEAGALSFSNTGNLGPVTNNLTINAGAILRLNSGTATTGTGRDIFIGPSSGSGFAIIDVPAGAELTMPVGIANRTGAIGGLEKTGAGTLNLAGFNTFSGGTTIRQGTVQADGNSALGIAPSTTTIDSLGLLRFTGSSTAQRLFVLNNGTIEVPSGVALTLFGSSVGGGFLRGNGTYNLTSNTTLSGVTTFNSTTMNVTGPASATNFSNNGAITVNSGQTFNMNYATNGAAGRITVNGTMNVTDFTSYGLLTVPAGGLINNTGSNMVLGGGSTTFVGSVANPGGKIDLGGQQLIVRGGLLVTNGGTFASGNGVRNGTTVADFGAIVKGNGPYQSVITQNGGQYLPGNSPGTSQVGDFFINPGGNLIFQITDAGPSVTFPSAPGTAGNNPGWGLTQVFTSLTFSATPSNPYTITMQTQLPPPAAPDTPGAMSSFDPNQAYQWLIFDLQPGAVFNGTFDPSAISFATSQFVNSTAGGTFSLTRNGGQIFLTFTPVPEPEVIFGVALGGLVGAGAFRRLARRRLPRDARV